MKIVFISNYFNHHQKPFSDEMYNLIKDDYYFIETTPIPDFRKKIGYGNFVYPSYVIKYSEYNADVQKIIDDADILLKGSAPEYLIKKRKKQNKIVIRYSERILRKKVSVLKYICRFFVYNIRSPFWKPIYMMCASAYTASDYHKFLMFFNKCYKWGYFPEIKQFDNPKSILKSKQKNSILWVGRLLELKHPEMAINLAIELKKENISFNMDIIGSGEMYDELQNMIKENDLKDDVHLLGLKSPELVRNYMEKAEIFLFTSDKQEGWGAVLNESMGSLCAVVASRAIGAAPFLIQHEENGFIYDKFEDFVYYVKKLLNDCDVRRQIALNAYKTMSEIWSPKIAAERFLLLCEHLIAEGKCDCFEFGPCSRA